MMARFLSSLVIVLLAHYAYIVQDSLLAALATTLAVMLTLGNILSLVNKGEDK